MSEASALAGDGSCATPGPQDGALEGQLNDQLNDQLKAALNAADASGRFEQSIAELVSMHGATSVRIELEKLGDVCRHPRVCSAFSSACLNVFGTTHAGRVQVSMVFIPVVFRGADPDHFPRALDEVALASVAAGLRGALRAHGSAIEVDVFNVLMLVREADALPVERLHLALRTVLASHASGRGMTPNHLLRAQPDTDPDPHLIDLGNRETHLTRQRSTRVREPLSLALRLIPVAAIRTPGMVWPEELKTSGWQLRVASALGGIGAARDVRAEVLPVGDANAATLAGLTHMALEGISIDAMDFMASVGQACGAQLMPDPEAGVVEVRFMAGSNGHRFVYRSGGGMAAYRAAEGIRRVVMDAGFSAADVLPKDRMPAVQTPWAHAACTVH